MTPALMLIYFRVVLYVLSALGLVLMATRKMDGAHREKVILAAYFVLLAASILLRALGRLDLNLLLVDYVGTPLFGLFCLTLWQTFLRLRRR